MKIVKLLFGLLLLADTPSALATITLPFSTTYNCAEQDQSDTTWATGQNICDGIRKRGDWTTSNGSKEQITSPANYSSGGGGRGQRHWIGNAAAGEADGSGGIDFPFSSRVTELYIRFYTRWETGLKIGGASAPISRREKLIYTFFDCGPPSGGGCGVWDIEADTFSLTVSGTSYTQGSWGWNQLFGGGSGSDTASDGSWHWIEFRMKTESSDAANDGIAQVWVDGVMRFNRSDIDYKGATGWVGFGMPENHQFRTISGESTDMYQDFDDVAVQTTGPIGALGGGGDTTAPSMTITSPTSTGTHTTKTTPITISGTGTDAVGITAVTYSNAAGGSGSCSFSGTTSITYDCSVNLTSGSNVITVTGTDAAANDGTDVHTETYTPTGVTTSGTIFTGKITAH